MTDEVQKSGNSAIKVALAAIPALLIVSVCIALYLGATADREDSKPYEGEVTVDEVSGYLRNLNVVIGERRIDTESGQRAFRQVNAMTMGALGPENLGYEIFRNQKDAANGLLWPTIWVDAGKRDAGEVVVVAIPQAESGTGLAFAFALAEYLASFETVFGVRIVFYPPLVEGDLKEWLWERCGRKEETLRGLVRVTGGDPEVVTTVFRGPGGAKGLLGDLSQSKLWNDQMEIEKEGHPDFEVFLIDQAGLAREKHALQLIQLLPAFKDLVERVYLQSK